MPNALAELSPTATGPAQGFLTITPSDTVDAGPFRWVRVGAAGTIRYRGLTGDIINQNVAAGEVVDGWIARVHAAGTTATGLVGAL